MASCLSSASRELRSGRNVTRPIVSTWDEVCWSIWDNWQHIPLSSLLTHNWKVKVKFSHTRYWALSPKLIPVYRQSACMWLFKSSAGSRLPLLSTRPAVTIPAKERHCPSTSTKLYCLVTEAHRCEQLAQGCYAALSQWELNPRPIDHKFNALSLSHCVTHCDN